MSSNSDDDELITPKRANELVARCAADISPEAIKWLWPGRVSNCDTDEITTRVGEVPDKPTSQSRSTAHQPFVIADLFGKPPLLQHEDRDAYMTWEQAVLAELQPRDLFESIWARDIAYLTWEVERGRRLKTAILESARPEAIRALVRVRIDDGQVDRAGFEALATKCARQIFRNDMLGGMDLREEDVIAQAYRQLHNVLDTLERQITASETRRNKVLRDLEVRREKQEVRAWFSQLVHAAQTAADVHWPASAETSVRGTARARRGAETGRPGSALSDATNNPNSCPGETS